MHLEIVRQGIVARYKRESDETRNDSRLFHESVEIEAGVGDSGKLTSK